MCLVMRFLCEFGLVVFLLFSEGLEFRVLWVDGLFVCFPSDILYVYDKKDPSYISLERAKRR